MEFRMKVKMVPLIGLFCDLNDHDTSFDLGTVSPFERLKYNLQECKPADQLLSVSLSELCRARTNYGIRQLLSRACVRDSRKNRHTLRKLGESTYDHWKHLDARPCGRSDTPMFARRPCDILSVTGFEVNLKTGEYGATYGMGGSIRSNNRRIGSFR